MSSCPSVLELLLPSGSAGSSTIIGGGCPETLRPVATAAEPPWDIILLAPSAEEASNSWLDSAAEMAARSVSARGFVYVIGPFGARRRIRRALRQAGLSVSFAMLHVPDAKASRLLLPLESQALQEAVRRLVAPGLRQAAFRAAVACSAARWLQLHPSAALVLRRRGAEPLAGWVPGHHSSRPGIVAIRLRRHVRRERVVVYLRSHDRPAVAKAVLRRANGRDEIAAEAAALDDIAPTARSAGVEVPVGRLSTLPSGCRILVQETIDGTPAAWALAGGRVTFADVLGRVAEWLDHWGIATRVRGPLSATLLQQSLLAPAAALVDSLPEGTGYLRWLERRCRAAEGADIPFVATHGDLTMTNILLRSDGRIGIVDWEAASARGLPLTDLYYAVVDAAAALHRYQDRSAAFERCFEPGGLLAAAVRSARLRLSRSLELSDDVAALAFHACWLRHAVDEQAKRAPGESRPFLRHLQQAARSRDAIPSLGDRP